MTSIQHKPHGVRQVNRRAVLAGLIATAVIGCASDPQRRGLIPAAPHDRQAPQVVPKHGFFMWCHRPVSEGGGKGDVICPI